MFIKGFAITLGFVVFLFVAWPAILVGISGVAVISAVKSSDRINPEDIKYTKGTVEIGAIQQEGHSMAAVIRNNYEHPVFNLRLTCWGGPSYRDASGWLKPGEKRSFSFAMAGDGPYKDCTIGFDIDEIKRGPGDGEQDFDDSLRATAVTDTKGSLVSVRGSIINYSKQRISGARVNCYFTKGSLDTQYIADVAANANAQSTGTIDAAFTMPYRPPTNGMFCKVASTFSGDYYK